jgi:hypothetical protein
MVEVMNAAISAINPQKYGLLLARVRPTLIRTEEETSVYIFSQTPYGQGR